ncbi:hypothetical protein PMPD1_0797 [Paramixta manurensis]|uniref:Uncharacterized protein n=1 Tax=Paramixta manurensis TaxID=2740817 RepID=A0A6M8U803_9GAMM|nr:hypothetical protein PMPD1_0797 [Erwiniaceae bacterium PD-1]
MYRQPGNQALNSVLHQRHQSTAATWDNPLPPEAKEWLLQAALHYGVSHTQAARFAAEGRITLDALTVVMVCLRHEPVPFWLALGYLPPPGELHPTVWHHALLRSNDVAMAMNGSSFGIDNGGNAILTKPLPFDSPEDAGQLAACLNDFNTLASSLTDLLLELKPPAQPAASPAQHQPSSPDDRLMEQAMLKTWHVPLMTQVCEVLGPAARLSVYDGCLCAIDFPERQITLLGDGDERHLLIATAVSARFSEEKMHPELLRANSELMALSQCAFSLSSSGVSLLSRLDSQALNANDIAGWLADFMTLATACDLSPSAAATTR